MFVLNLFAKYLADLFSLGNYALLFLSYAESLSQDFSVAMPHLMTGAN